MKIDEMCSKVILSEEQIQECVKRLGKEITEDFKGEPVTMVGLLNGCNPFFSDLLKEVDLLVEVDYIKASSYQGGIQSTHDVKILKDLDTCIKNKNVIVVDDIIDTGDTLRAIMPLLEMKGAKTIKSCVLLKKNTGIDTKFKPDYFGTEIPNEFVLGYGLDYNEYYRNLRYIGAINKSKI